MKKKISILLGITMLISMILISCNSEDLNVSNNDEIESDNFENDNWFEDLRTTDLDGNDIDSSIFKDNDITLINVWATWCSPCVSEVKYLGELARELEGQNVGIKGLLVEMDDTKPVMLSGVSEEEKIIAEDILKKSNADYQQILVSEELLNTDFTKTMLFPTTYFVDKDGKFVGKPVEGAKDKNGWKKEIEKKLEMIKNE